MSGNPDVRVIKIGGSLLEQADLASRFRRWLQRQEPARNVLIVGGGKLVDAVRDLDNTFKLDPSSSHWAAIDCMSITVRLVAELLPEAELVAEWSGLRRRLLHMLAASQTGLLAFDVAGFLKQIEGSLAGTKLPHGWQVTSDSISASLAVGLPAGELVLLKGSLPRSHHPTAEELSESGYVDEHFPLAAAELKSVRCVSLSADRSQAVDEVQVMLRGE